MEPEERVSRRRGTDFFRIAALAGAVFAACVHIGCGIHDPSVRRCGTEVPDPEDKDVSLVGCVESADEQPAARTRVIAWPDSGNPAPQDNGIVQADTQFTDETGRYEFGKELNQGKYTLYFEDTVSAEEKRTVQRQPAVHGLGHLILPSVRLVPPTLLMLLVKDYDTHEPIAGAVCMLEATPFKFDTTRSKGLVGPEGLVGREGLAYYYVPPGIYQATCADTSKTSTDTRKKGTVSIEVPPGTASVQTVLYLGASEQPLPPPKDFTLSYDENSGVVDLRWSRVTDIRLLKYGITRVDINQGGGAAQISVPDTEYLDVPFSRTDSVQEKNLLYNVYSLKRDPGGYMGGSRSHSINLDAPRPWAYGPRIDSLAPLDSLGAYHVGDTVRIVAAWTNRMRDNDSLFWRVGGPANLAQARRHPPASGRDTLAFALTAAGSYQISLTILDAEGYRSWLSASFRF